MPLFSSEPVLPFDAPDSAKLEYVYAYVLRKEREERAARIRRWIWIGIFVFSLYLSYMQALSILKSIGPMAGSSDRPPVSIESLLDSVRVR